MAESGRYDAVQSIYGNENDHLHPQSQSNRSYNTDVILLTICHPPPSYDEVMRKEGVYGINAVKTNKEAEHSGKPSSKAHLIHQSAEQTIMTNDGRAVYPVTQSYQSNNPVTQSYQSDNNSSHSQGEAPISEEKKRCVFCLGGCFIIFVAIMVLVIIRQVERLSENNDDNYNHQSQDPCDSGPCRNGGLCEYNGRDSYTCRCTSSYSGYHCANAVLTPCSSFPCQNGGSCFANHQLTNYACVCSKLYQGRNCEFYISKQYTYT